MLPEPWRIEMLGTLRARQGTREITRFPTQKIATLLAFLACQTPRPCAREELMERFWPQDSLEAARNSLRVALSSLRRLLEPPDIARGSVLIADRNIVRLQPGAFSTDVADFETALNLAAHASEADKRVRLQQAVETYRGDFLPGSYDTWALSEREHLQNAWLEALRRLVHRLAQEQDFDRACTYARRAVQADPLREESHNDLIRLLLVLGQPTAALQQYQTLERLLQETLQATPSAETRHLAEQARQQLGHDLPRETLPPEHPNTRTPEYPSLPATFTRFVEPEATLQSLLDRLATERLLTLTGLGGIGKTRLALEAARRCADTFPGGVGFVLLADISDPALIPAAILESLRLPPAVPMEPLAQVIAALSGKPCLLVLDNFEQLQEGGLPSVVALREALPDLTLLVTSRHLLGLPGEREFPVQTLPIAEAMALFIDRAQAARPDFQKTAQNAEEIATLCERLEGIPLAIELAAARAWMLTPGQILSRLDQRLEILVNRRAGKDARHRSLRATIEWSYRLLDSSLRRLLARLTVFQGGWTLEAVEALCEEPSAIDLLDELRSHSLILVEENALGMRFRMLETIRAFAVEQLSPAEQRTLQQSHLTYFLALAEAAEPRLQGPDARRWLVQLDTERENLRAALAGAIERQEAENALRLATALGTYWEIRGLLTEARSWLQQALEFPICPPLRRASALFWAGLFAAGQGDLTQAERFLTESRAIAEAEGDRRLEARAWEGLGRVSLSSRRFDQGQPYQEQALTLFRSLEDRTGTALALQGLALLAWHGQRDTSHAHTLLTQARTLIEASGDTRSLGLILENLGTLHRETGDLVQAAALLHASQEIWQSLGDTWMQAYNANNRGAVEFERGHPDAALAAFQESLRLSRLLGDRKTQSEALWNLAEALSRLKAFGHALPLLAASVRLWQENFAPLNSREQAECETARQAARQALGSAEAEAAWSAGYAMTTEQALQHALTLRTHGVY